MSSTDAIVLRYKLACLKKRSTTAYNALISDVTHDVATQMPELEDDVIMLNDINGLGRSGALNVLFALGLLLEENGDSGIVTPEP